MSQAMKSRPEQRRDDGRRSGRLFSAYADSVYGSCVTEGLDVL